MRLINATTLKIEEFLSEDTIPPFAILSHTWEEEECTLQQFQKAETYLVTRRKGFQKIRQCCVQALEDGLQWAWVDTCCIDKTSTAELSEAINSMFRWYRIASVCYAFLSDLSTVAALSKSRWFTRGWTLQELVAPMIVRFYDRDWRFIGSKLDLRHELHSITTIEEAVLVTGRFETISIARRMAWAAARQTTRIEDRAYSLMGIFDVNMPLLYGEGHKAFARLQEEIMKISDDQSLFAWGLPDAIKTSNEIAYNFKIPTVDQMAGIFARSPADFTFSDRIHVLQDPQSTVPPIMSNNGVRIELQVYHTQRFNFPFAVLYCTLHGSYDTYLGFPMVKWRGRWMARCGEPVTIAVSDLVDKQSAVPYSKPEILHLKAPTLLLEDSAPTNTITIAQTPNKWMNAYSTQMHCSAHTVYSRLTGNFTLSQDVDALHAAIVFSRLPPEPATLFPWIVQTPLLSSQTYHQSSFDVGFDNGQFNRQWLAAYPSFAVLIGGPLADPWVDITVVLDDDDHEAEFKRLHTVDAQLIRRCMTKENLLALFSQKPVAGRLPRGDRVQNDSQLIALWRGARAWHSHRFTDTEDGGELHVITQVRTMSTSLVEHGRVVLVAVGPSPDEKHDTLARDMRWWNMKRT